MAKQIKLRRRGEDVPVWPPVRPLQTAEDVLELIAHHMTELRRLQANSGCRVLRTVLNATERIVQERETEAVSAQQVPPPDD